ncbi:MAG: hypothetical protein WD795_09945 [Woeseia sp.]
MVIGNISDRGGTGTLPKLAILALLELVLTACGTTSHYNSLDLALLPCEQGDAPLFFHAVEFDGDGRYLFPRQVDELHARFRDPQRPDARVSDVVFFLHGWNKNPSSAEADYQNFLCRLHGQLRKVIGSEKGEGKLVIVGIFWPSTITNAERDPVLLKPLSYYRMRERADVIAQAGLARLLRDLSPVLEAQVQAEPVRAQFIGHSFGGRMLNGALRELNDKGALTRLLLATSQTNVVMINAALAPQSIDWLRLAVDEAIRLKLPARATDQTNSHIFNMHSFNDDANRTLFRIASLFNDDPSTCAAGACGIPGYATICVDAEGEVRLGPDDASARSGVRLNAWNVDASRIVFEHSDIYKGRIAALVTELLYDPAGKKPGYPWADATMPPAETRCDWLDADRKAQG